MKIAYHPIFAKYSPGNLLRKWALEKMFNEESIEYYDMLGTASNWKLRWATGVNHLEEINIITPNTRGRFIYQMKFGFKDKIKRIPFLRSTIQFLMEKISFNR